MNTCPSGGPYFIKALALGVMIVSPSLTTLVGRERMVGRLSVLSTSNFQNGSEINAESAFLTINSLFRIELTTVELYIFILYCSFVRLSI